MFGLHLVFRLQFLRCARLCFFRFLSLSLSHSFLIVLFFLLSFVFCCVFSVSLPFPFPFPFLSVGGERLVLGVTLLFPDVVRCSYKTLVTVYSGVHVRDAAQNLLSRAAATRMSTCLSDL